MLVIWYKQGSSVIKINCAISELTLGQSIFI